MMRLIFVFTFLLCASAFSQEDTTKIQQIEGVSVSINKEEDVYHEFNSYVMDVELSQGYFYLLMREMFGHHLVRMDDHFNTLDTLLFSFHPLEIVEDCENDLIILSKDSMFIVKVVDNVMKIVERSSKRRYISFYKDCKGNIGDDYYMQHIRDFGNTTIYQDFNADAKTIKVVAIISDSSLIRGDQEEATKLSSLPQANQLHSGEINASQLAALRKQQDDAGFFQNIKKHPSNHPLFVFNDTLFLFDHLHNLAIEMDKYGTIVNEIAISDSMSDLWNNEMFMDKKTGRFFAINSKNGVYTFMRFGKHGEVERSVRIEDHIYLKNIMVYDNYVYFTAKEEVESNLNKLFRYRL